jgi:hypothetical protein
VKNVTNSPQNVTKDFLDLVRIDDLVEHDQRVDLRDYLLPKLELMERFLRINFSVRGYILLLIEQRHVYEAMEDPRTGQTFSNFTKWLEVRTDFSRSDAIAAKETVKDLRDDGDPKNIRIPLREMFEIPRCNLQILRKIKESEACKKPEVWSAAQTMSQEDFLGYLRGTHNLLLEAKEPVIEGDKSQIKETDTADAAGEEAEANSTPTSPAKKHREKALSNGRVSEITFSKTMTRVLGTITRIYDITDVGQQALKLENRFLAAPCDLEEYGGASHSEVIQWLGIEEPDVTFDPAGLSGKEER